MINNRVRSGTFSLYNNLKFGELRELEVIKEAITQYKIFFLSSSIASFCENFLNELTLS